MRLLIAAVEHPIAISASERSIRFATGSIRPLSLFVPLRCRCQMCCNRRSSAPFPLMRAYPVLAAHPSDSLACMSMELQRQTPVGKPSLHSIPNELFIISRTCAGHIRDVSATLAGKTAPARQTLPGRIHGIAKSPSTPPPPPPPPPLHAAASRLRPAPPRRTSPD